MAMTIIPPLQDAEKAIDLGIDGIIVSNHGEYHPGYISFLHLGLNAAQAAVKSMGPSVRSTHSIW